jgi:hypothetical protein
LAQLLGGEEDELDLVVADLVDDLLALLVGQRGVQDRGVLLDGLHLVLLQRDERRDDDGGPVDEEAGELVDRRLARARRHDAQRVAPTDRRPGRPRAGPGAGSS